MEVWKRIAIMGGITLGLIAIFMGIYSELVRDVLGI